MKTTIKKDGSYTTVVEGKVGMPSETKRQDSGDALAFAQQLAQQLEREAQSNEQQTKDDTDSKGLKR